MNLIRSSIVLALALALFGCSSGGTEEQPPKTVEAPAGAKPEAVGGSASSAGGAEMGSPKASGGVLPPPPM